jgi:hypothetical protein
MIAGPCALPTTVHSGIPANINSLPSQTLSTHFRRITDGHEVLRASLTVMLAHHKPDWTLSNWLLLSLLDRSAAPLFGSDCVPIHDGAQYVGEIKCVTGKVLHVKEEDNGIHFVDFCEDRTACPFSVVVFAADLEDVGDVHLHEGQVIEINGAVKLHEGRPQIVLNRIKQLRHGATMIPLLPKNYDVEDRGHYSAGRLDPSKKPKKQKVKPSATAGSDVEGEDPMQ